MFQKTLATVLVAVGLVTTGAAVPGLVGNVAQADDGKTWLKVQFYTLKGNEGRWGGTDGDVFLNFGNFYYGLDSPGDSFEQGDYDIFYLEVGTTRTGRAAPIRSARVHITSSARNQIDNWSYTLEVYELVSSQWEPIFAAKNQEAYAVSRDDESIPVFNRARASSHFDASARRWERPAGRGPSGVNLSEVTSTQTNRSRFVTVAAGTYDRRGGGTWTMHRQGREYRFHEARKTGDFVELTCVSGDHNDVRIYRDHVKYRQRDDRGNRVWRTFPDSKGQWR